EAGENPQSIERQFYIASEGPRLELPEGEKEIQVFNPNNTRMIKGLVESLLDHEDVGPNLLCTAGYFGGLIIDSKFPIPDTEYEIAVETHGLKKLDTPEFLNFGINHEVDTKIGFLEYTLTAYKKAKN
ncbi:MAG: hypothetical protein ACW98D_19370, partial [Promethearchaeota archaeon]